MKWKTCVAIQLAALIIMGMAGAVCAKVIQTPEFKARSALFHKVVKELDRLAEAGEPFPSNITNINIGAFPDGATVAMLQNFQYSSSGNMCSLTATVPGYEMAMTYSKTTAVWLKSGWSDASSGLKLQISLPAAAAVVSNSGGWARFEVVCTITNVGTSATGVTHLARLYVVDKSGVTNACERSEDVKDMVPAKQSVAPGHATSWKQDGAVKTDAGTCRLFAVWDRDKELKSPAIEIIIK